MPIYEYHCRKCGKDFELMRRIAEMDAPAKCAHCASRATSRKLSRFAVVRGAAEPSAPEDESWYDGYGEDSGFDDHHHGEDHGHDHGHSHDHDQGHDHDHGHSHDDDGGGDDFSWVKDFQ